MPGKQTNAGKEVEQERGGKGGRDRGRRMARLKAAKIKVMPCIGKRFRWY